jgi:hypothetical protein
LVSQRWSELASSQFIENIYNKIDEINNLYNKEFCRNYSFWDTFGEKTFPPYQVDEVLEFTSQIDASNYLKEWIQNKVIWLNKKYL